MSRSIKEISKQIQQIQQWIIILFSKILQQRILLKCIFSFFLTLNIELIFIWRQALDRKYLFKWDYELGSSEMFNWNKN